MAAIFFRSQFNEFENSINKNMKCKNFYLKKINKNLRSSSHLHGCHSHYIFTIIKIHSHLLLNCLPRWSCIILTLGAVHICKNIFNYNQRTYSETTMIVVYVYRLPFIIMFICMYIHHCHNVYVSLSLFFNLFLTSVKLLNLWIILITLFSL